MGTAIDTAVVIHIAAWWDAPDGQHLADGDYAERYWLPIIGPSALLAGRQISRELHRHNEFVIELETLARSLGLGGGTGERSRVRQALGRLEQFRLARRSDDRWELSLLWPYVPAHLERRMPAATAREHAHMRRRNAERGDD